MILSRSARKNAVGLQLSCEKEPKQHGGLVWKEGIVQHLVNKRGRPYLSLSPRCRDSDRLQPTPYGANKGGLEGRSHYKMVSNPQETRWGGQWFRNEMRILHDCTSTLSSGQTLSIVRSWGILLHSISGEEKKSRNGVYVPMSKSNPIDRRVYVCTDLACQLSISGDTHTRLYVRPWYMVGGGEGGEKKNGKVTSCNVLLICSRAVALPPIPFTHTRRLLYSGPGSVRNP